MSRSQSAVNDIEKGEDMDMESDEGGDSDDDEEREERLKEGVGGC
jgi:hypothetical protein